MRTTALYVLTAAMAGLLCTQLAASPVDLMIGSRGYGMGGAYVAIANDPSAAYWNPACLARVENISIMESNWILQDVEGLNVNYVSLAVPIKYVGTMSGSWLLQHATLEEGWDDRADGPEETSSANEHAFSLSVGRQLWDKFLIFEKTSVGFSINRLTFTTDGERNGAGIGFDLGLATYLPLGIQFGFVARSLGTDVMGEKVDPELRAGVGYAHVIRDMHRLTVAVDAEYKRNRDYQHVSTLEPAEHNLRGHGGLEYSLLFDDLEISIRGGGNLMAYSTLDSYGFAAGAGVKYLGYSVQYAFRGDTDPDVTLGFGHRISIIVELNNLGFKKKEEAHADGK